MKRGLSAAPLLPARKLRGCSPLLRDRLCPSSLFSSSLRGPSARSFSVAPSPPPKQSAASSASAAAAASLADSLDAKLSDVNFDDKTSSTSKADLKPYEAIPGPRGYPIVGNLIEFLRYPGGLRKMHMKMDDMVKTYGPLVRYDLFGSKRLLLADADEVARVHQAAGKVPRRPDVPVWTIFRKSRNLFPGILQVNGEEWVRFRRVLSEKLLRMPVVEQWVPAMVEVGADLVKLMRNSRVDSSGHIPHVENLLSRFGIEAVGTVIFDARVGCLVPNPDPNVQKFVKAINGLLDASHKLLYGAPFYLLFNTPTWNKMAQCFDDVKEVGELHVERKLKEIRKLVEEKGEAALQDNPSFLAHLLSKDGLTAEEISTNCIDLLAAGVDTTAFTVLFTLYELSRHPEAQAKLHQELDEVLGNEKPTVETLKRLPYLKACVREGLRLHPITVLYTRILEQEFDMLGYRIPAGVSVDMLSPTLAKMEKYFPKSEEYRPERWLTGEYHPYAATPFGFGPRMCVGRRVAEAEVHSVIAQIMQAFDVKFAGEKTPDQIMTLILVPNEPVKLCFTDRKPAGK
ncbi:hypothetical protein QOT17_011718 [Balamuthia mandrillaris]